MSNLANVALFTDSRYCLNRGLSEAVAQSVDGGIRLLIHTEKRVDRDIYERTFENILTVCANYGAKIVVRGRPDMATREGVDGLYLEAEYISQLISLRKKFPGPFLLGVACSSVRQAVTCSQIGADFTVLGPTFKLTDKNDETPLGAGEIGRGYHESKIPVYAAGGLSLHKFDMLRSAGVRHVALGRSILGAPDIRLAANQSVSFWEDRT